MALSLQSSAAKRDALRGSFRLYAKWHGDAHPDDNLAELLQDQGRKYATELYNQTAAIAPTDGQIESDVISRGWKIPRKFPDGRLGRGWPAQWTGNAYLQALKTKLIKKKRGRNARAANIEQENAIRDARPTLQQMQAFVIKIREDARLFLASGWLGAILDLGGAAKDTSGEVSRERSGAETRISPGLLEVVMWNNTPGIVLMDQKKGLVEKARAVRAADMLVYVKRKMEEAARRFFRAAA